MEGFARVYCLCDDGIVRYDSSEYDNATITRRPPGISKPPRFLYVDFEKSVEQMKSAEL
jgi:hypothetical protein